MANLQDFLAQIGIRAGSKPGAPTIPALGSTEGALGIAPLNPDYEEAALAGKMFFSYCAARATSVPATAQIGNIVWNPADSGVDLILCTWAVQIQVTSATTLGITLGYSIQGTVPTTVTVADAWGSTILGAAGAGAGKAKAYAIATIATAPTPVENLIHNTAAIAVTGIDSGQGDFRGRWIVPPGHLVALSAITAAIAAAGMTSTLTWKERVRS